MPEGLHGANKAVLGAIDRIVGMCIGKNPAGRGTRKREPFGSLLVVAGCAIIPGSGM